MNPWASWSISVFLIAFVAAPLTLLSLNLLDGWDLNAICPGTEQWCAGQSWSLVVKYFKTLLIVGSMIVWGVQMIPNAVVRI